MRTTFTRRPTLLAAFAVFAVGASGTAAAQTVTCSTAAGSTNCFALIPDAYRNNPSPGVLTYTAGTLNSQLVVPAAGCASGPVSTVTAQVKIKHTWVGDLVLTLIHPNGLTSVVLLNRPNAAAPSNCSRDDVDATFQDGAGTPANSACNFTIPAVTGVLAPASPLAAFNGLVGAGTWTLRVQDANGGEYGYLEDWSLTFACGPVPTVSIAATGPFAFFPGLQGQFTVTRVGDTTNPLTVNYTVGGTAVTGLDYTALSGTVTIPGGQASAPISVPPLRIPPGARTVVATLTASGLYTIGGSSSATVTIVTSSPGGGVGSDIPALSPLLLLVLAVALAVAGLLVIGTGRFRV